MTNNNAEVIKRSVESANILLDNPVLSEQLGPHKAELVAMLGRIVPIEDNDMPGLTLGIEDRDAIPTAIVDDSGIVTRKGNIQLTSIQRDRALESYLQWGLVGDEADAAVDSIVSAFPANGSDIKFVNSGVEAGLCGATAIGVPASRLGDLPNQPEGRVARLTMRPSLFFPQSSADQDVIDADLLIHELIHVRQKEDRPITLFTSQKDANKLALRDELEAYHFGSLVRSTMVGDNVEDESKAYDPQLQMAVEAIRYKHNKDLDDPYEPGDALMKDLTAHGYGKDRMLAGRFDFISTIKAFRKLQPELRRTSIIERGW